MPHLVAQGNQPHYRWRRSVPDGKEVILGRAAGAWSVPWDEHISRKHVRLRWVADHLSVQILPEVANPVFLRGSRVESCEITAGEHFVIGSTTFTLSDAKANVSLDVPRPVTEQTFSPEYLRQVQFRNANQRIDVLTRIPEIISSASNQTELLGRIVNVLLSGIHRAAAVAIVSADDGDDKQRPQVLHWDRRQISDKEFQPSAQLIRQAIQQSESVVYLWTSRSQDGSSDYTVHAELDWAYTTPVAGDACRGWAIYVAGRFLADGESRVSEPGDLRDDLKFTELAASTLGNLLDVRNLERRQAGLSQFFSPVVLDALVGKDPDKVLAPHETEVSVLYCDLRGFSRKSEQAADDLLGLLERVSRALGVMTRHILEQGGVVGDFHGDAAMGFWGWPIPQSDSIERACKAALEIRAEFETAGRRAKDPLTDFRIGLGIATGRAVAGKIGTVDQVKVTVFGPVVNLASRLEDMTKSLRVGILLDEYTAKYIRENIPLDTARVRRLAVVRPYGMRQSLEVSELLPPVSDYPQLTDQHLADFEQAVDALLAGDWNSAFECLHRVPADDRAKDFLTVLIAQHNRTAPDDWDGIIPIGGK